MKAWPLLIGLILFTPAAARASSVVQVAFNELVSSSEFIFEGQVVDKRAEFDGRGTIHTYVTFKILDVLKGTYPGRTITLRYLGGTVGEASLYVADLTPPALSEKGIYFVESLDRPPVHPLYGWDQGHFLVVTNDVDRAERVFSRNGKPIIGFENAAGKASGLSTGIALGLSAADASLRDQAMTVHDFKLKVLGLTSRR